MRREQIARFITTSGIAAIASILILPAFAMGVFADGNNNGNNQNNGKNCEITASFPFLSKSPVPDGSKLVLNVKYQVTDDEDSGFHGYWALDNYTKTLKVWAGPDGHTFYVITTYDGIFHTFAGAHSPQNGVTESKDAVGCFQGGYNATFTATGLNPNPIINGNPANTHGQIGAFDFGGTKADILSSVQTGGGPFFDWEGTYFVGGSSVTLSAWGWQYNYQDQTWNNFYTGSSGDIVV